jgi:hypothetical protein
LPSDSTIPFGGVTASGGAAGAIKLDDTRLSPVVWIYMLCVITPVEFFLGSIALTPLRVLLLIMVVPLATQLFSGKFGKVMIVDIFFFIHMAWATLAVGVNNPNRVVENVGSAAVEFLGGYLIARAFIRTPAHFEALIKALVLIIIVLLPFGIPELFSGHPLIPKFINSLPGVGSVEDIDNPKRMGLERVQNVFAHPIHYGLYCSLAFTLLLMGMHGRMSMFKRQMGCGIIFASVFISLSSGALLAVILQVGLIAWALIFAKVTRKWLLLLGLFAVAYVVVDVLSNRTPMKVLMTYATFSSQTAYYRANINEWGWYNVRMNPVFGLGLRNWIRPAYMQKGSVDNFWLVMAMRYGIPGVTLLMIGYFAGLFKVGLRNLTFSPRVTRLRLAWMITMCGLSFTMTTVHVWTAMYSFVFFFYGSSMWMLYYTPADEGSDQPAASNTPVKRGLQYRRTHTSDQPLPDRPQVKFSRDAAPDQDKASEVTRPSAPRRYSRFNGGRADKAAPPIKRTRNPD